MVSCVSATKVSLQEPVGPSLALPSNGSQQGYLRVYSAHQPVVENIFLEAMVQNNNYGQDPFLGVPSRTDYTLYSVDGQRLKRVRNSGQEGIDDPALVALAPGLYRIEARSVNQKAVSVPVAIAPGQVTLVHLDGNWQPPLEASGSEIVSLPHGVQVGWRAHVSDSDKFQVRERVRE